MEIAVVNRFRDIVGTVSVNVEQGVYDLDGNSGTDRMLDELDPKWIHGLECKIGDVNNNMEIMARYVSVAFCNCVEFATGADITFADHARNDNNSFAVLTVLNNSQGRFVKASYFDKQCFKDMVQFVRNEFAYVQPDGEYRLYTGTKFVGICVVCPEGNDPLDSWAFNDAQARLWNEKEEFNKKGIYTTSAVQQHANSVLFNAQHIEDGMHSLENARRVNAMNTLGKVK